MGGRVAYTITWAFRDFGSTFQPSLGWAEVGEGVLEEELAFKQFRQMSRDRPPKGEGRGHPGNSSAPGQGRSPQPLGPRAEPLDRLSPCAQALPLPSGGIE